MSGRHDASCLVAPDASGSSGTSRPIDGNQPSVLSQPPAASSSPAPNGRNICLPPLGTAPPRRWNRTKQGAERPPQLDGREDVEGLLEKLRLKTVKATAQQVWSSRVEKAWEANFHDKLTEAEAFAIMAFTVEEQPSLYGLVGPAMDTGTGNSREMSQMITLLRSALSKLDPVQVDKAYRGLRVEADEGELYEAYQGGAWLPGDPVKFSRFSSFTSSLNIAGHFSGDNTVRGIVFCVMGGTFRKISLLSAVPDENELMEVPPTTYKVIEHATLHSKNVVTVSAETVEESATLPPPTTHPTVNDADEHMAVVEAPDQSKAIAPTSITSPSVFESKNVPAFAKAWNCLVESPEGAPIASDDSIWELLARRGAEILSDPELDEFGLTRDELAAVLLFLHSTPLRYRLEEAMCRPQANVDTTTLAAFYPLVALLRDGIKKLPACDLDLAAAEFCPEELLDPTNGSSPIEACAGEVVVVQSFKVFGVGAMQLQMTPNVSSTLLVHAQRGRYHNAAKLIDPVMVGQMPHHIAVPQVHIRITSNDSRTIVGVVDHDADMLMNGDVWRMALPPSISSRGSKMRHIDPAIHAEEHGKEAEHVQQQLVQAGTGAEGSASPRGTADEPPLRGYQSRIVMDILQGKENALVVLPTGAGKTRIASTVMKAIGTPALFLVPTQELVTQQAKAIRKSFGNDIVVAELSGAHPDVSRDKGFHVCVATPEKFMKEFGISATPDVTATDHPICQFRVIVFDEVHRCTGNHPYMLIATSLNVAAAANAPMPLVLALSAQPTFKRKASEIQKSLEGLLASLHIADVFVSSTQELKEDGYAKGWPLSPTIVNPYHDAAALEPWRLDSHRIVESFLEAGMDQTSVFRPAHHILVDAVVAIEDAFSSVRFLNAFSCQIGSSEDPSQDAKPTDWPGLAHSREDDPEAQCLEHWYSALHLAAVGAAGSLQVGHAYLIMPLATGTPNTIDLTLQLLETASAKNPGNVEEAKELVKDLRATLYQHPPHEWLRFRHLRHQGLMRTADLLAAYRGASPHSTVTQRLSHLQGLIFVRQRLEAEVVAWVLSNDPQLQQLQPTCVYSMNQPASPSISMKKTNLKTRLERFENSEVKLLITTSILEEGYDVPAANMVLCFDPIDNTAQFVQGGGRARAEHSVVGILQERPSGRTASFGRAVTATHTELQQLLDQRESNPALRVSLKQHADRIKRRLRNMSAAADVTIGSFLPAGPADGSPERRSPNQVPADRVAALGTLLDQKGPKASTPAQFFNEKKQGASSTKTIVKHSYPYENHVRVYMSFTLVGGVDPVQGDVEATALKRPGEAKDSKEAGKYGLPLPAEKVAEQACYEWIMLTHYAEELQSDKWAWLGLSE